MRVGINTVFKIPNGSNIGLRKRLRHKKVDGSAVCGSSDQSGDGYAPRTLEYELT